MVSRADRVIFVDAFKGELPGGFQWKEVAPSANFEFTTHALSPEAVLFWCEKLFDKTPEAHCLLIAGEIWDIGMGLSEKAMDNLAKVVDAPVTAKFIGTVIFSGNGAEVRR